MKGEKEVKEITVKRITPVQLPTSLCFQLNYIYHTELGDFKVMFDKKEQILYVNNKIRDDVTKFVQYVSYAGSCIGEVMADGGLLEVADYIFEHYGEHTWNILSDAYRYRKKLRQMEAAEKQVRGLLRLITALDESEEPPVLFNDYLAYYISLAGDETKRKTLNNMVGYSSKYLFWLGYLAGSEGQEGGSLWQQFHG